MDKYKLIFHRGPRMEYESYTEKIMTKAIYIKYSFLTSISLQKFQIEIAV